MAGREGEPVYAVWASLDAEPAEGTSSPAETRAAFGSVAEALMQSAQHEADGHYRLLRVETGGEYDPDTRTFVGGERAAGRRDLAAMKAAALAHNDLRAAGEPSIDTHAAAIAAHPERSS